ncbi:cysteine hydrolase family protein [Flavobacterium sp.]|jgi:nicotinamidase-related amidase|uniref:cysteine hydrolase family protein n=1 Tax=Flavobacterium sp. TaxID=239 RepID=UPI0037BF6A91
MIITFDNNEVPLLLLIDIQKGFNLHDYWGNRNNIDAELKASMILNKWRKLKRQLIHVQHCSDNRKSPLHESHEGNQFMDIVKPIDGEEIIQKSVNSAFIGTKLLEDLNKRNVKTLILVGLTTDHCVSTSARMASNYGFKVFVVEDATATFDKETHNKQIFPAEIIHQTALASLNNEFATIVDTDFILNSI